MTQSPPRPDMPPEESAAQGAARPFMLPPAPLPVAPWWASSTPDPTPPEEAFREDAYVQEDLPGGIPQDGPEDIYEDVQDILESAAPSLTGPAPASLPHTRRTAVLTPPEDFHAEPRPAAPEPLPDQLVYRREQPLPPPIPPLPGPSDTKQRQRRRKGPLLAVGAALVALAATAAAVAVIVLQAKEEVVPQYAVKAAKTAAGLRKDNTLPEASAAYPFIMAAARAGGVEDGTVGAVYLDPVPKGQDILFLGGTAAIGDPAAFLKRARPSTVLKVAKTVPGKHDGLISCGTFAVLSATHQYCAWATKNSYGFIASNIPTSTAQPGLASLTTRMRADLEKRTN